MRFAGIIPARYGSSRFPGKPLCDIDGLPMIVRVCRRVARWDKWTSLHVATDDERIIKECKEQGIPAIMTDVNHSDCLDRANEAAQILGGAHHADRIVIIQGDEPLFEVETLDVDLSPPIVNFYTEVRDERELYSPDSVKVVVSRFERALYFSRYTLPFHEMRTRRDKELPLRVLKQIGVYSFTPSLLAVYAELEPTYLEQMEGIGLLRLLENEIDIDMRHTEYDSVSVDTEDDRTAVEKIIRGG